MSDDMALAMPSRAGAWDAHPWPSWGSLIGSDEAAVGSGEFQPGIILDGLFFLLRAPEDRVERIGAGRASCLLVEASEQAWVGSSIIDYPEEGLKEIRKTGFRNVCTLAAEVPSFLLHLSLNGRFWERIEEALVGQGAVQAVNSSDVARVGM